MARWFNSPWTNYNDSFQRHDAKAQQWRNPPARGDPWLAGHPVIEQLRYDLLPETSELFCGAMIQMEHARVNQWNLGLPLLGQQLASISSSDRNACSVLSIAHDFGSGDCEGTGCVRSNLANLHAGHWGSKFLRTQKQSAGKTVQIQTTQDSEACEQNSRVGSQELLPSRDHKQKRQILDGLATMRLQTLPDWRRFHLWVWHREHLRRKASFMLENHASNLCLFETFKIFHLGPQIGYGESLFLVIESQISVEISGW